MVIYSSSCCTHHVVVVFQAKELELKELEEAMKSPEKLHKFCERRENEPK